MEENSNEINPFGNRFRRNKYFDLIKKMLVDKKMEEEKLLETMRLKRKSFFSNFNRVSEDQQPFKKVFVEKLCPILGLRHDDFLVTKAQEENHIKTYCRIKNESGNFVIDKKQVDLLVLHRNIGAFHQSSLNPNIRVRKIPLVTEDGDHKELIEFYEEIAKHYKEANEEIVSHELLLKGDNTNPNKYVTYTKAQNHIFNAIEFALRNGITYKRVFYLSPSQSIHKKNIDDPDNLFKIMMIESSIETLKHIKLCMEKHSEKIEFFVSPFSSFRAQTLIDNNLLLTEDYKKDRDFIKPFLIYLDRTNVQSEIKKMRDVFLAELKEKRKKKIYKLDLDSFFLYLDEAYSYLSDLIDKREKFLVLLKIIEKFRGVHSLEVDGFNEKQFNELLLFTRGNINRVIDVLINQKQYLQTKIDTLNNM